MKIETIMGVTIEKHHRRKGECSMVVMRREGAQITVLSCDHYEDNLRNLIYRVVEAIRECPHHVDELMAGDHRTLQILEAALMGQIRVNIPRRPVLDGAVSASFHRLRNQDDARFIRYGPQPECNGF